MPDNESESTKFRLRVIAGILAFITFLLVVFRTIAIVQSDLLENGDTLLHILRIIFPLSLGLLFGYIAWKGTLPFTR